MKISSAELMATVAIVTSAAVLQIREHMPPHNLGASSTATAPHSAGITPSSCETSRNGIVPASCEPAREQQRPAEHAPLPQRGAAPIWV